MAEQLKPLERENQLHFHTGRFSVQLELPKDSSLQQPDIDRIAAISSWDGDINTHQIDRLEGGRSVMIRRSEAVLQRGVESKGLQISGACYIRPRPISAEFYGQKGHAEQPRVDNFRDTPEGPGRLNTTGVRNGRYIVETRLYTPTGSYEKGEWIEKIKNTQRASKLEVGFSTPTVEAYGRYLDLRKDDNHLGFIVFSAPNVELRRFSTQLFTHLTDNPEESPPDYFNNIASLIGKSSKELHRSGYGHRQLHFTNFYHLEDNNQLQIVDWGTMIPLDGVDKEPAMKRAIDIVLPQQKFEELLDKVFTSLSDREKSVSKFSFFNKQLDAYAGISRAESLLMYASYRGGDPMPLINFINSK